MLVMVQKNVCPRWRRSLSASRLLILDSSPVAAKLHNYILTSQLPLLVHWEGGNPRAAEPFDSHQLNHEGVSKISSSPKLFLEPVLKKGMGRREKEVLTHDGKTLEPAACNKPLTEPH